MSDLAVSERRIRPIQDAIATGNWKQALQLCEKWQKKGEKSDRFLALKASILVNQPDNGSIDKGRAETLQLCRRATPVTDIEALFQLQDNLKRLTLQREEGPKLWDRAVTALPNDKELIMTWLKGSFSSDDWLMAQKAAMALRKAFPKERQYEFWNMLLCYLAHQDSSLPEKDRTLFGMLAYRLLSKAAEAAPSDKSQILSPGKAIATPEELALLVAAYNSTARADEAVKLLQSEALGLESSIAQQDPAMVFSLLLDALKASSNTDTLLTVCQNLLSESNPRSGDYAEDDRIWRVLLQADTAQHADFRTELAKLINSILERKPNCRAAHLARIDLFNKSLGDNPMSEDKLITAIRAYYQCFKERPFCFDDLSEAIHALSPADITTVLPDITSKGRFDAEKLFLLKWKYSILSEQNSTTTAFLTFASEALGLHKQLPKDKSDCPEAALLAAVALLRAAVKPDSLDLRLQSSYLLGSAYSKFGEYYPLATRVIQLYRVLGLAPLASERFNDLSVKNMQWETVGHLLLTRLSSLQPIAPGSNIIDATNPLQALDIGLEMLSHMEQSLDKAIQRGLEGGSYSNVIDSIKVKQNIHHSLNRQIYAVEERKIQNIVGVPVDLQNTIGVPILDARPARLVDLRDFTFFNNYGTAGSELEGSLRCGPLPGDVWLDAMALPDHLTTYLQYELAGQAATTTQVFESLQRTKAKCVQIMQEAKDIDAQLTTAEQQACKGHIILGGLVELIRDATNKKPADFDAQIDEMVSWFSSLQAITVPATTNGIEVPTWEFLHTSFTRLETARLVALTATVLTRRAKSSKGKTVNPTKEKVLELQDAMTEAEKAVQDETRRLKSGINAPGVLSKLIDVVAGRVEEGPLAGLTEYKRLSDVHGTIIDEADLEAYCGKLKDGWEDVLNGVLAVKVSTSK